MRATPSPPVGSDEKRTTVASTQQLRRLGRVITLASLAAIAFATLLPAPGQPLTSHLCIICGAYGSVDAILNILLFLPLGVGLSMSGVRWDRAILTMCALSALIETAQFFVIVGRDATLGDVLMNSIGGALGFAIGAKGRGWLAPSPRSAMILAVSWSIVWLALQTVSSIAFVPSFPIAQYYGQIAPTLSNFALFRGHVRGAAIGPTAVPDFSFTDSRKVRELLRHGTIIAVVVEPAGPTSGVAPIVRVADSEQHEILLVAQSGSDLVFGIRFNAAALRLRSPLFLLPEIFSDRGDSSESTGNDALRISAQYRSGEVLARVQARSGIRERRASLTPSLGWTLILPFQWYIRGTGTERFLTWTWIFFLLFPIGYWAERAVPHSHQRRNRRRWTVATIAELALVGSGFVVVPRAFGFAGISAPDLLVALAGIASGHAVARVFRGFDARAAF